MLAAASIDTDTDPNSASFAAQKAAPAAPPDDNSTDTPDTTPAQDAANAASQPRLYAFKRDYE